MTADRQTPQPADRPYPTLRLMGAIDWTEGFKEMPPEDAVARAYAVPSGPGRGRVDDA